jgi:hypothetical protein
MHEILQPLSSHLVLYDAFRSKEHDFGKNFVFLYIHIQIIGWIEAIDMAKNDTSNILVVNTVATEL